MKSLIALLPLLVCLASCSSCGRWYVTRVDPSHRLETESNLIADPLIDFRGRFGDFAVLVSDDVTVLKENLDRTTNVRLAFESTGAVCAETSVLLALEFDFGAYATKVDTTEKLAKWQREIVAVVEAHAGLTLFSVTEGVVLAIAKDQITTADWPQYTIDIVVPSAAIVPTPSGPPSHHPIAQYYNATTKQFDFSNMPKSPFIEEIVAAVEGDNIRVWIERLSEIFSRLSIAPGATEAENIIIDHYPAGWATSRHRFRTDMSNNVIGELRGTRYPDEYVLIGAHYDSRSTSLTDVNMRAPGADDNGSGTGTILDLVTILLERGVRFEYSVRFLHWSGEEQGLVGSRALAREYRDQGERIVCYLNLDMSGWRLPNRPIAVGMKDRSITPWLLSATDAITRLYVPETYPSRSSSCCSDYLAFFENGFPTVGYFESEGGAADYPHYHRSTDTPDQLVYPNVEAIGRAFVAGFLVMAVPA